MGTFVLFYFFDHRTLKASPTCTCQSGILYVLEEANWKLDEWMLRIGFFWIVGWLLIGGNASGQTVAGQQRVFTDADRRRGSITAERAWWDVQHYDLSIRVFPKTKRVSGSNKITFTRVDAVRPMQIDLQPPLAITRVSQDDRPLAFSREGNCYFITFDEPLPMGVEQTIEVFFEGQPVEAKDPPWSGGLSWTTDSKGRPFIATSCQGIGASIWWPCKDHGADEPDRGVDVSATVPKALTAVANGRLLKTTFDSDQQTRTFHWRVTEPINSYAVNLNVGHYVSFNEKYSGSFGILDLQHWVLDDQRERAMQHFREAPRVLKAFEYWFGKYPFYEDSYKLVSVPYLGMEHQSSVAYGNGFQNGYQGQDLSGTGIGMLFDYIIVHESGHEWFGNSISMRDTADMWIHEGFTNYSESLFVEYHFGRQKAADYVIGLRKRINNDRPIIGTYDVNHEGSGDMYYKGANMLHTLRHIVNDRQQWRQILTGLNTTFRHQTVTTEQVENYLSEQTGRDLSKFFDQYLRTTKIPRLMYRINGPQLTYWFENVVPGLSIPVDLYAGGRSYRVFPREAVQSVRFANPINTVTWDRNFYIDFRQQ